MRNGTPADETREAARRALEALRGLGGDDDVRAAKGLVEALRNQRDYELMGQLAEAVSRRDPEDARNRRLYAQYLIDSGKATAAIDVLQALARRLPKADPEFAEATGLLGRAYKQIYFDAGDKDAPGALAALDGAIAAYRGPYERDPGNTWHGVNLVALLGRPRSLSLPSAAGLDQQSIAERVVATLERTPPEKRDEWYPPTLAEASLGLRDLATAERYIRAYVAADDAKAFQIASTLRQFTQIWDLERRDERGRALVDMLRARLMQLKDGALELVPDQVRQLNKQPAPDRAQLEAVLGTEGPKTYAWWKTGLERARSVAAIRQRLEGRVGSGFLVRAGDLGVEPAAELLVLTNWHVVNEHGATPGIRPEEAEVVFEAVDPDQAHPVAGILWSSTPDRHDASLLRLAAPVTGIAPIPVASGLPVLDDAARVYVIGHPGGRELQFSFQDNELLDHEGPPLGNPQIPGVCRLHYRAPTEGGSSGSPVFNSRLWQVIALHHKGGKLGMPRLNGKDGTYAANEGISIQSIRAAVAAGR
jgi:tetratricopeptide (TPR) repeat protein